MVLDPTTSRDLSDEALRRALDAAPDGIIVADDDGRMMFVNPMAGQMFGYERDELVGEPVELLIPVSLREAHVTHRSSYTRHPRTRPMGSGLDLRGRHKSGDEFPVEISLSAVSSGGHTLVIAIVRDVTERRKAAEELMLAHEELALVGDRERIARDLHDTVIQRLFAVGLSLQGALARAENAESAERIDLAIDAIDGTIRDIRTAIFALHTRRTPTAGPRDDVLALTREAARALGFEPHVDFNGLVDTAMTAPVRDELVPTLREALSNVAKHAGATRVAVSVAVVDHEIVLRVVDNGIGIGGAANSGRGLGNMAERAEKLGGILRVGPGAGGGTLVEWRVPLDGDQA